MKKVELHLHLDGSLDRQFASLLVGRDVKEEMISKNDGSLKEYIEKFDLPISLLQEYKNIKEFSYRLAKSLEKDDVIYAEIRFCPLFHTTILSADEVIRAINDGLALVTSVKTNLILCMMRNFSYEENFKVIELTKKWLGHGVCGIDLAGDEANYKTSTFRRLFEQIRKENIPYTIHAGEADDYTSVDDAISFGAKRIGHGVNSIYKQETVEKLVKNGILLEICPKSNLDTKSVLNINEHPIKKLVEKGVKVCINTDNRTVSDTSLEYEYSLLRDTFNFTESDFKQFNINAIDGAFISEEEKEKLKKLL